MHRPQVRRGEPNIRMILRALVGLLAIGALPRTTSAQSCHSTDRIYFAFEVDSSAAFVADSSLPVRPAPDQRAARTNPSALLFTVVVDTLGVPELPTFKVLRMPSRARVNAVRAVLARWRFTPARVDGCPVRQLMELAVTPAP